MASFKRMFKRLRLQNDDILLIRQSEDPLRILRSIEGLKLNLKCGILFVADKNGLKKVPFEDLEKVYLAAKKNREEIA
jgi:hypothetical protein